MYNMYAYFYQAVKIRHLPEDRIVRGYVFRAPNSRLWIKIHYTCYTCGVHASGNMADQIFDQRIPEVVETGYRCRIACHIRGYE